jgi:hypothetical protein
MPFHVSAVLLPSAVTAPTPVTTTRLELFPDAIKCCRPPLASRRYGAMPFAAGINPPWL